MNITSTRIQSAAVRANAPAAQSAEAKEQQQAAQANPDAVEISENDPEFGKKEWTVLVWANGKANGADRLAPSVVRELEVAGSDDNMDIVAQLGRKGRVYDKVTKDWSGTKRYHVQRNMNPPSVQEELMKWFLPPYTDGIVSPVVEDMGKADMGSSASLSEFLQWGMKEYPAKNYAVVIYGEGGGMAGAGVDEETGHRLTAPGIEQAFREAKMATGQDIDLVAFDSDYMAGVETAAQLEGAAKYMVASQGGLNLGSIQLDMVMKDLKFELAEKGEVTPEQLAKWFVFESKANPGPLAEMVNPTLSAIDLDKMGAVKDAYGALSEKLAGALNDKPNAKEALRQAIGETQAYAENDSTSGFYGDYRDVGHFAAKLKEDVRLGEDVHKAADALLKATGEAVIDQANHGQFKENSTGMSAYLPLDAGYDLHSSWKTPRAFDPFHGYTKHDVAQNSEMLNVLKGISEEGKFNARLRGLGLGNGGIVKTHKALGALKKAGKFVLGIADNIGSLHGWSYARGNEPGGYFGIPAKFAVPLAPVGGLKRAGLGLGTVISSARNDELANKGTAITDGAMGMLTGLAVTGASGLHIAEMMNFDTGYGHLKQPLGMVAVGAPIARSVIGAVTGRKAAVQAKEANLNMSLEDRQLNLQSGAQKEYYLPPAAKFLVNVAGGGAMDMSQAKG